MRSEFEKHAQNKIAGHSTEVDIDALWEAVEPHVKPKKKKRRFLWIFFLGIGLIAGSSIWYFTNIKNDLELSDKSNYPSQEINNMEEDLCETLETEPKIESTKEENLDGNEQKTASIENVLDRNQKFNRKHAIINEPSNEFPDQKIGNTLRSDLEERSILPKTLQGQTELKQNEIAQDFIEENNWNTLDNLPNLDIVLIHEKKEDFIFNLNCGTAKGDDLPSKFKKWSVGLHGGVSLSLSNLDTIQSLQNDYLDTRRNSEKLLETIHFGLTLARHFKKNWYVKSGINYARIADKFSVSNTIPLPDTIPNAILSMTINTVTNDTIFQTGELILNHARIERRTAYNNYHLFDIPVIIGYQFEKNKWSFGAEAGILINISTKRKGTIFNQEYEQGADNELYDLKTDNNNWFRNNVGLRGLARLNIGYHLNENWMLHCSPTLRWNTKLTGKTSPIRARHRSVGINLGLRKRF